MLLSGCALQRCEACWHGNILMKPVIIHISPQTSRVEFQLKALQGWKVRIWRVPQRQQGLKGEEVHCGQP